MPTRRPAVACLILTMALVCATCAGQPQETEILWDTWGVPHIYADSHAELYRAFGWTQMNSHADLILRLIGQARGRAAEYWGEEELGSDRWVRTMGIPGRAAAWYESQSPEFRANLDAFAAGMNEFAGAHGDSIADDVRVVLPVTPVDILAHTQRVVHFEFVTSDGEPVVAQSLLDRAKGSNAWAIAPQRSASGNAMLLVNPHLLWSGSHLFYEAHLVGPGVDFYGATLVGFPVLALGFSESLGWTHTVNTYDGSDAFELTLRDEGYLWDGEVEPFVSREETLAVRQEDGSLREERLQIRASRHGPVIAAAEQRAVALRVAGLDRPGMLEQWWDMMRARNLAEFEHALERLQLPMFNVVYADRDGNILYLYNGAVPRRASGDFTFWESGAAPGDDPALLWSDLLSYDELPRVLNPGSGWLQNANDPPWTTTYPAPLDPDSFPAWLAPQFMHFRAQQSARLLSEDDEISFEDMVAGKHSTRMLLADRLLDDLLAAVEANGAAQEDKQGAARSSRSSRSARGANAAREAAAVLAAWDRHADAGSRGAVLFALWAREFGLDGLFDAGMGRYAERTAGIFATPWDPAAPFATPDGLQDPAAAVEALQRAANKVRENFGALDVPWGDVFRLRMGGQDLPGNGGEGDPLGLFRVAYYVPDDDGRFRAIGGDTFYAAVEFGEPQRAEVLLSYGNSSQPGSPHFGDQLQLFSDKKMRPAWRTRGEIEAHLEERTVLPLE